VKLVCYVGTGLCLLDKRFEQDGFRWPAMPERVKG
jgi:transposase